MGKTCRDPDTRERALHELLCLAKLCMAQFARWTAIIAQVRTFNRERLSALQADRRVPNSAGYCKDRQSSRIAAAAPA